MTMSSPLETGGAVRTTFDTGAGPVAALQTGDAGAPAVLLVAGFTGSKEDFGPVLAPLAAGGFRVTAIDLPGQYETPGPDDPGAYAPDALARTVLDVAALLGAGVRLLGHSYGGLVSRAAVIAEPARFTSLVLLGSGPAQVGDQRRAVLEMLEPALDASGVDGVYEATLMLDATTPGYVAPPPELAAFYRARFLAGPAAMLRGMAGCLRTEPDRVAELAATGVPTLVAHGVDDVPWPPEQQADMAQRLGARYAVIDDAAHSPAIENVEATVELLLDFWRTAG